MSENRRTLLQRGFASASIVALAGCDQITSSPEARNVLRSAEDLTRVAQRLFLHRTGLAREYGERDIDRNFRGNGTINPRDRAYQAHAAEGFVNWRLAFDGLVDNPLAFSLEDLKQLPSRTQITRHDCVEGWSAIGKWTGVRMDALLTLVRLKPEAKYLVFHCADMLGRTPSRYYESIDLEDARHEQTILAYALNDAPLPVKNGAPLRLRVERQLGYKHAKYVQRIEAVAEFAHIAGGRGGYWEDRGYEWYAGI